MQCRICSIGSTGGQGSLPGGRRFWPGPFHCAGFCNAQPMVRCWLHSVPVAGPPSRSHFHSSALRRRRHEKQAYLPWPFCVCAASEDWVPCRDPRGGNPFAFYYQSAEPQFRTQDGALGYEIRDVDLEQTSLEELLKLYLAGPSSEDLTSPFPKVLSRGEVFRRKRDAVSHLGR